MVMQLLVNDFLVSEVVEDTAVILNDMPEAWCDASPSRAFPSHTGHTCNAPCRYIATLVLQPANIVVDAVRFVIANPVSMIEVDFIEELEAHTDKRQCTSLFTGIRNISSYFYRVLYADPKFAATTAPTTHPPPPFSSNPHLPPPGTTKPSSSPPTARTATNAGTLATTTAAVPTPKRPSTTFFPSSPACKRESTPSQACPTVSSTTCSRLLSTLVRAPRSPSHTAALEPRCHTFTTQSFLHNVSAGKRPFNMLIWMLHFTQQLGGASLFTPGSSYGHFSYTLVDTLNRMISAESLSGSRSITCLSHDLVTMRSLRSFIFHTNADIALQLAESIYSSANDQGDDYAITEALKLYRRAARLKPASGAAWWGIGSCFEFWGARRCSPRPVAPVPRAATPCAPSQHSRHWQA